MKDLPSINWDLTRAGVALYLGGVLVSLLYYSQFGIFSLEILRPQCILIGALMFFFYGLIPLVIFLTATALRPENIQTIASLLTLAAVDFLAPLTLNHTPWLSIVAAATALGIQILFFGQRFSKRSLEINLSLGGIRPLAIFPLFAIHYAVFIHPSVPGHFGGGKPISVDVYTEPQDLPANRFEQSKNRDRANIHRDSYRLQLLYETVQDYYFVEARRSNYALEGYAVTRLPKLKVIRIDYFTPSWVSMRGANQ